MFSPKKTTGHNEQFSMLHASVFLTTIGPFFSSSMFVSCPHFLPLSVVFWANLQKSWRKNSGDAFFFAIHYYTLQCKRETISWWSSSSVKFSMSAIVEYLLLKTIRAIKLIWPRKWQYLWEPTLDAHQQFSLPFLCYDNNKALYVFVCTDSIDVFSTFRLD